MRLASGGRHVDVLTRRLARDARADSSSPSPARRAAASPRCSASSPGSIGPPAGRSRVAGVEITRLSEDDLARFRRDTHRLHVPVLPPHPHAHRARERRGAARAGGRADALARARRAPGRGGPRASAPTTTPSSSRAASSSAWPSRARSRGARACSWPTSPRATSTRATGKQIIELLVALNRDSLGSTLVLVTHDAALAAHADRIVTLRDGRVVSDEAGDGRPV